ncbi:MAG: M20/M25/M40 family metallo-hydrolase [Candidatus Rokuibacteriota bacterium]
MRVLRSTTVAVLLLTLLFAAVPAAPTTPVVLPAEWILDQVRLLSSPEMEGRGSGTPGGDRAAAHISRVFRDAGLTPGGDGGSFLQVFSVNSGTRSGPPAQTANVIGVLPGRDSRLQREAIVVGAHYDHLGREGQAGLALDHRDAIHHGADDNASGTAVMLALARAFAAVGGTPRTLVFVAFSGEELGLLGSQHYSKNPAWPLERTILMLNLDMVGRLRHERLYGGGVDSGTDLRAVLTEAARGLPLSLELRGDPWAPSDHSTFYRAGRPVLFFFTGIHADYHRPSDTWDKINVSGLATVQTLAARVINAIAVADPPPQYVKLEVPPGHRVFFGIVPEFAEARPGVRVRDVRPGSPADLSGVRTGDLIVELAGADVTSLEDLTLALRARRAGERVDVLIVRNRRERRQDAT